RQAKRYPCVAELAAGRRRAVTEGREVDRQLGRRRNVQLGRACLGRDRERNALAAQECPHLRDGSTHPGDGRLERRVVQALRELRRAGAEAEDEATARAAV